MDGGSISVSVRFHDLCLGPKLMLTLKVCPRVRLLGYGAMLISSLVILLNLLLTPTYLHSSGVKASVCAGEQMNFRFSCTVFGVRARSAFLGHGAI